MPNPFAANIEIKLSKIEVELLISIIKNTVPDKQDEIVLYGLYAKFQRKLEENE